MKERRFVTCFLRITEVDMARFQALGNIRQIACGRQGEIGGTRKDQVRHSVILDLFHVQKTIVVQG